MAATVQSVPGPQISADYVATNAAVIPSLGRPLSGAPANITVNILTPGTTYGDRATQLQLRIAKIFRIGGGPHDDQRGHLQLFNSNAVLTQNNAFASWQQPLSILNPRWAKIVLQYDF